MAGVATAALTVSSATTVVGQYEDREGLKIVPTDDPAVLEILSRPHERLGDQERPKKYKELTRARSEYQQLAIGPDGEIWIYDTMGAGGPTSVWQAGTPGRIKVRRHVNDLAVTPDGVLWAASGRGVHTLDEGKWVRRWPAEQDDSAVIALDVTVDGSVMGVGGEFVALPGQERHGQIVVVDVDEGSVDPIPPDTLVPSDVSPDQPLVFRPTAIEAAPDGSVWVAGERLDAGGFWGPPVPGRGFLLRSVGGSWEMVQPLDGQPNPAVPALATGPDGSLWAILRTRSEFAEHEPHLAHFDGQAWTVYSMADGVPERTGTSLAVAPDGTVWLALNQRHESGGVASFDGEAWTTYLPDSRPWEVAVAPDGTVWWTSEVAVPEVGLESFSTVGLRAIAPDRAAPMTTTE